MGRFPHEMVAENKPAAESVGRFRRRHLNWFSPLVALRSRLLRQRCDVVDIIYSIVIRGGQALSGSTLFEYNY